MSPDLDTHGSPLPHATRIAWRGSEGPLWWIQRLVLPALGILVVLLYLGRLGGFPLQDPDEGRYAEIPREMLDLGDWITPRLNYVDYFEKPPLLYWLVALAFRAFGTSESTARLVPALAGLATIGITYVLGRRLFGRRAALVAAATLATAPLFFVFAQALVIDMLLTLLLTACLALLWCALQDPTHRGWPVAVACASALAVLAKGLIGLVLPGLVIVSLLAVERDWRLLRSLLRPAPIVAFLAIAAPWFVVMAVRHPEFLHEFFVVEHLQRFATDNVGHPEGPLYYIPVLVLGALPWTLLALALGCSRDGQRAWREMRGPARRFLVLWVVVVVGFFSIARSKLAGYVLPALPPALLVLGGWLERLEKDRVAPVAAAARISAGLLIVIGSILLALGLALPSLLDVLHRDVVLQAEPILRTARFALAVGGGAALLGGAMCTRRRYVETLGLPGATVGIAAVLALTLLPLVGARSIVKTSRHLADVIARHVRPEDLVVQYRTMMQGLPFYLGKRIVQIDAYGEIRRGAERSPERSEYFWDGTARLEHEWASGRGVFVVTSRGHLAELSARLAPAPEVVLDDGRRVLLTNRQLKNPRLRPATSNQPEVRPSRTEQSGTVSPRPE